MMETKNAQLLTVLAECTAACNMCSTTCLSEENVKMMAECIRLDMDCAPVCGMTAAFIARDAGHAKHLLKECAEICGKCAAECAKHDVDHWKQYAEVFRKREQVCSDKEFLLPVYSREI